ncbi:homoserine dehydrogenase [Arenimonas fontis]|uniref:homoserine dehydrogenase n=1 Tax=Arenimonas fontis TaxID=2608255 RepID=A0A5B2ZDA1_9GAMM|nr:homoserine dehydrogenase [Arenimonas fontis]KAA2285190.1 homoserine dehydrogenase [Arenimonas fontis]
MSALPKIRPGPPRRIALFGAGTVGRALLERLAGLDEPRLRLCWLANSRRRVGSPDGIAPAEALARLQQGEPHDGSGWLPFAPAPGDIVVDATASEDLAAWHPRWLRQGLAVVSANKLALGGPLARAREIQQRVAAGGFYGDAATVGAGLPLLRCLRELRAGGDRIAGIAGVLSGTLAWLLDGYDGRDAFSARVREAVARGYAEPDPRVDLTGEDVRRKLLILARCAGRVLRYVARLDERGARAGLEALAADDALALGRGNDNRVAIWSCRYRERPLQIQGPGAGAGVTAAALLDDLLRCLR